MQAPADPTPVKFIIALLRQGSETPLSDNIVAALNHHWGPIDFQGSLHPFDQTNYYQKEMGNNLHRQLIAFQELRTPEELASAKLKCIEIEASFSVSTGRTVNLDIGYLDHNKIVLASVKGLSQKIYLSQGVYADLVARYSHGRYQPFEWTFPDFKAGRYDADLSAIRLRYLEQLSELRRPH